MGGSTSPRWSPCAIIIAPISRVDTPQLDCHTYLCLLSLSKNCISYALLNFCPKWWVVPPASFFRRASSLPCRTSLPLRQIFLFALLSDKSRHCKHVAGKIVIKMQHIESFGKRLFAGSVNSVSLLPQKFARSQKRTRRFSQRTTFAH